jgi:hypothetical protein
MRKSVKIDLKKRYVGITHNQLNSIQNEIYLLPSVCGYCSFNVSIYFYHIHIYAIFCINL